MLILNYFKRNLVPVFLILFLLSFQTKAQLAIGVVSYSESFNGSIGTMTAINGSNGNWVFTNGCSLGNSSGHSINGHVIFSGSGCTFGNGSSTTSGNIITPTIAIGSTGGFLSFNYIINGECGGNYCSYDNLAVYISTNNGTSYNLLVSSNIGYQTLPPATSWANFTLSLTSYSNQTVILMFNFNSVDGVANNIDGIYLDDVSITNYCAAPADPVNSTSSALSTRCGANTTTTLSATGSGTISWFANATSTTVLGSGSTFVTPTLSAGSNLFYAMATNTCTSSKRTPISVNVTGINILSSAGASTFCPSTPIVLTATTTNGHSGNGSLGNASITTTMYADSVRSAIIGSNNTGPNRKVRVASTSGFKVGQEVMLITMQDANTTNNLVGQYEYTRIQSISADTLLFSNLLSYTYNATTIKHQVIVVPNYDNLTIVSGGYLTCHNWDGSTGGVLPLRVKGFLDLQSGGMISATGTGYRGTPARSTYYVNSDGAQGEGYLGVGYVGSGSNGSAGNNGSSYVNPNGNGGGGGIGTQDAAGGGGGGHANAGNDGGLYSHQNGYGGKPVGDAALSQLFMGGAGAEGGGDEDGNYPGNGGSGGGIIAISTASLNVIGGLFCDGVNGGSGFNAGGCGMGGGGGGAGGSIYLQMLSFSGTAFNIEALGGTGGAPGGCGGAGGNGSIGRIRIDIASGTVSTNPLPYYGNYPLLTGLTYSWNTSATTNSTIVFPTVNSNYTVQVTSAGVCSGQTATISIPVHPSPTISVVATPTICAGNNATLNVTGANTYTWSTGTNGSSLVTTPPTNTTIGVYGTSSVGCISNSVATAITVYTLPILSIAGNNTVCEGGSVAYTGSGAATYNWSFGGSGATATLTPGSTTTFTLNGTSAQGCSSLTAKTLTVIPLPTVTAAISNASVCAGKTVALTGTGASTYTWSTSNGTISNPANYTPTLTTSYSLTGTSAAGCTSTNSAVVFNTVVANPVVSVNPTNTNICIGQGVLLSGAGANTYTWNSPFGFQTNGSQFFPGSNTSFTLTGTSVVGCVSSNSAVLSVVVNNGPSLSLSGTPTLCAFPGNTLTFATPTLYASGSGPMQIGTADFNNDGKNDFVSTNVNGNSISYYSGTGNGAFNAAVTYTTGIGPVSIVPADFNNDGNTDIAFANSGVGVNSVSIMYNNGSGVFSSPVTFTVGLDPESLTAGDFNNDGKADLAVSNYSSNSISILLGNPSTTFNPAVNYAVGTGPRGIICSDFNNDSFKDLAVANVGSSNISILYGSTSGTFNSAVNYPANSGIINMADADFNGDGYKDIVTANTTQNSISILLGSSSGTFAAAVNYTTTYPYSIIASDINTDGKMDVTTFNASGNSVTIFPGIGNGTFGAPLAVVSGSNPQFGATGDFNADGKPDLLVSNYSGNNHSVLLNNSQAALSFTLFGANSYTWSTGSNSNRSSVSPTNTTVYKVLGKNASGCTNTLTHTVTIVPLPTVTASSSQSICLNQTIALNGSGANTYTWTSSTGTLANATAFTPTVTSNYSLAGTSTITGCTSTNNAVATITVAPLPTVVATANSNTVCAGLTVTLSGSGANTYTFTGGPINNTAFTPTSTGNYTLTGTDLAGCTSTNVSLVTVTVVPRPVVSGTSSAGQICLNQTVTLTGSGANTYTWSGGINNGTAFSPTSTSSYTLAGTSTAGCTSTNAPVVTITVNSLPIVNGTASSPSICINKTVALTGSGANTYTWTSPTGTLANNTAFSPTSTAQYTVSGTSTAGCSNTNIATVGVTVAPLPIVVASTNTSAICFGSSLTLSGSGASTYTWSNGAPNGTPFSPTLTTTYSLSGTDIAGCTSTNIAVQTITVYALPTVTANSSSSVICNTQTVAVFGSGASTYTWTGGVTNNTSFTPSATANYSVNGTDNNGCVSLNNAFVTITVNPLPIINANASQTFICIGNSITLNGSGAATYTWSSSTGTIANNSAFSPTTTANYSVTGTSAVGCASSNTANITVTVNPLPVLNLASTPTVICAGFTSTLSASGANTYTWNTTAQGATTAVTATTNTSYTAIGTSTAGCQNSAVVNLSVNPLPTLSITSTPTTICYGQSVTFTTSGASTYSWNTGSTTPTITVNPTVTTQYTITGVSAANCSNNAIRSVSVNPLPVVSASVTNTLVCGGNTVTFSGSGANTYTWTGGPVNNQTFMPMSTASYSLSGTSLAGCTSTNAAAVTVTVKPNLLITGNANIVPVGNTTSTLNFTDFGLNSSRTFSITNFAGASTLNIGSIFFTGPQASQFSLTTPPASVITTGTTGFVITLTPTNTGISSATVNITSDDCSYSTYTFVITASTTPASALNFDGTNDYVDCSLALTSSYTKEAWIRIKASTNGNNFISGTASSGGHAFWAPGIYSYKLSSGHDFTWNQVQDPTALAFDTWYHVAVTYDAPTSTMRLYKNGILVSSNNTVTPVASTTSISIGAFSGSFTINGDMDEVRVWNTARTQCQIQQFMNCEIPTTASGLVANYHFNQGVPSGSNLAVTTATDAASGNTGTLLNFSLTGTTSNWVNPSQIVSGNTVTTPPNVTLQVSGNSVTIPNGSNSPTITNNTSFGHLCVGGSSSTKVFSVTNTGTGTLNLGLVQYSGSGSFSIGTYSSLLNPASGSTFAVTFTPGLTPTVNTGTLSLFSNDCSSPTYSFVINATVNALPVLTVSSTSSVICNTQSVSITAVGADTYTWTSSSGSITNGVAFTPSATSFFSAAGTATLTGCTSTNNAGITISVNPLPIVTATATSFTLCNNSTVAISGIGADTYTWTSSLGSIPNNTAFSPSITTSYSLVGTNTLSGCTSTNQAFTTVTVLALPNVTANTTSTVICMNETVTLNGSGANTYTWTGGVIDNSPFSPTLTSNYTLTGTDLAGCTSTNNAFVTVSVNPLPIVTASTSNSVICYGYSTSVIGSGASTYTWTGGVFDNTPFTPTVSTTYSLSGTDLAGCTSTNMATVDVTVNPLPLVQALALQTVVCFGDTTSLHGIGASTYTWTGGVSNATSFTPVATAMYTVTGTDINGCVNQDSTQITVNPRPLITGTVSRNVLCYNDTITFNANGASTYTWSNGAINGAPTHIFSSGDYSLTGTNTLGCTSSNTIIVTLTVNLLPIVSVQSLTNAICFGKQAVLSPSGAINYTWSPVISSGSPFTPTATLTYTLIGKDANSCVNDTVYTLNVYPMPTLNIIPTKTITCEAETFTLTASGASLYTWSNGSSGFETIISPTVSTTYTLKGITDLGCADSTVYSHTVIPCAQPLSALTIYTNVSCLGKDDGAIIVVPTIPYQQYTTKYIWTPASLCPAQNCDTIKSLAGGTYQMKMLVTYTVNGILQKQDSIDINPVLIRDENGPCEIKIYTSISPNGDGSNDIWVVDNLEDYPKNRVVIFNRWGKAVFDKSGYNNTTIAWPEKNEVNLPASTYFYIIDLGNGSKPIKGYIELLGE